MKLYRLMVASLFAVSATVLACSDDDDPIAPRVETFRANLSGANEVPARTTSATGTATFTLQGEQLSWTIDLTGITNISGAHIHIGAAGVNGGILLNLAGAGLTNARVTGTFTKAAYVATPPAAPNAAVTWEQLIESMRTGGVYVNIHTSDPNLAGNNTPGDFPSGEVRGQVTKVT